jgi:hypothetical protein
MFTFDLRINKLQGAAICVAGAIVGTILFVLAFGITKHSHFLVPYSFFSFLVQFVRIIKPGEKARLCFFMKDLGVTWDDGICLVPDFFPLFHLFGIHWFWSLQQSVAPKSMYRRDDARFVFEQTPGLAHMKLVSNVSYKNVFIREIFFFFSGLLTRRLEDQEKRFPTTSFILIAFAIILWYGDLKMYGVKEFSAPKTTSTSLVERLHNKDLDGYTEYSEFKDDEGRRIRRKQDGLLLYVPVRRQCFIFPQGERAIMVTTHYPVTITNYDRGKKIMHYDEDNKRWRETNLQDLMSSTANLDTPFSGGLTIHIENDNAPSEKYMCFDKKKS